MADNPKKLDKKKKSNVVLTSEGNSTKHAVFSAEEAEEFNTWRSAYNSAIWNLELQPEE